jgi:hypothetical protein
MLPFVGVDGEGGDLPDEDGFTHHQYTMLRAGDDYITGPAEPQTWLDFITNLPRKHTYVSYFFDYDTTMMLRELPLPLLGVLVTAQPVTWGPYEISYMPRKELKVRHKGKRRETRINDTGTFFQCSFVKALERWGVGTEEQLNIIREGKSGRAHFGQLTAETIKYNGMECDLLEQLMTKFARTCEVTGYIPRMWQGPGQLAKAMFRKHGIPLTEDLPDMPAGLWEMAQACFYGGRFETSAVGHIRGPVEGWDINSAYPHACITLPCLLHGRWEPSKLLCDDGMYAVSFRHTKPAQLWFGLPVRMRDGSIRFPRSGQGWYWGRELASAQALGCDIQITHGWRYVKQCDCRWFDFMHRLYSIRRAIGKSEAGLALRLGMNSAYGVCAQSVGRAPYANPIWAGLITATTRARINHAIAQNPYDVYMVATDGLYCRAGALNLEENSELGGWERSVYPEGIFVVQPGLYFADEVHKTRGIGLSVILQHEEQLRAAWQGSREDGYEVPLRQFIGLRLGIARNTEEYIGEWVETSKRLSYDWSTKRRPHVLRHAWEGSRTLPYEGGTVSQPYSRNIGGNLAREMDRLEIADMPDWAETLEMI